MSPFSHRRLGYNINMKGVGVWYMQTHSMQKAIKLWGVHAAGAMQGGHLDVADGHLAELAHGVGIAQLRTLQQQPPGSRRPGGRACQAAQDGIT